MFYAGFIGLGGPPNDLGSVFPMVGTLFLLFGEALKVGVHFQKVGLQL